MKRVFLPLLAFIASAAFLSAQGYKAVRTFDCPEAHQGVAVDDSFFYGIGNQTIAKYTKDGKFVKSWTEKDPDLIKHFDGGIIIDGLLYCSHSNFPEVPMASSIEVFNPDTMEHVRSVSLGIDNGSCTWVVRGEGCWYVCFAHYDRSGGGAGGEMLRDASWTQIVQYDDMWRRTQGWMLPGELVDQLRPNSLSGALFVDGKFYCTGHDATRLFVLEFPAYGMKMKWSGSIDIPFHGQGIALDSEGFLWGIDRKSKTVIKAGR